MRVVLIALGVAVVSGCAEPQSSYVPPSAPVQNPAIFYLPASLKLISDMNTPLQVYFDGAYRCSLAAFGSCAIADIAPGSHTLRIVQPDGTFWESPYDYSEDELVTCIAEDSDVFCRTGAEAFFD